MSFEKIDLKGKRILLGATGALQCLSLGELIFACKSCGVSKLGLVLTPTAERMTSVYSLACVVDELITEISSEHNHIQIAREYERLVVAPATANFLAQAARGATANALELLHLSMGGPTLIVPAMNSVMWYSAPVQRNVDTLIKDGNLVLKPHEGKTYEGASRMVKSEISMAGTNEILAHLSSSFAR